MVSRLTLSRERARRIGVVRGACIVALTVICVYLFHLQVLRGASYREAALSNSMRRTPIDGPRGFILDREGRQLVKNRSAFDAQVRVDRMESVATTLRRACAVLELDEDGVARLERLLSNRPRPEVTIKQDLSLEEVARLEARALEWPEFRVTKGLVRMYPYGLSAAHALGYVGEIRDRQLAETRFAGYRSGDVVGQKGLEARYEAHLRGTDGARWVLVNSRGREIRAIDRVQAPVPGLDVQLALDLDVQRAAEEAFGEQRGAAVAIDPRNGEVLAIVSRPAFDPNEFASRLSSSKWRAYQSDAAHPMFDRASRATLPPGSVFKIVDAIAGLEEGTWDPDAKVTCNGRTVVHGDGFRCWRSGGHGQVSLREAVRGSCNVFFYHRGDEIGIDKLASWSRALGLGSRTGIDFDPEAPGVVPDPAWKRATYKQPWWPGETVSVAIGQGALQVTVLQVAMMMQVVANGGRAYVPHVVTSVGGTERQRAPEVAIDIELKASTLERVRDALWAVVNEREKGGTGGRAAVPGFGVSGKTGTAQAPDGPSEDDRGEHAWFAGYAPRLDPRIVVAVYVERGGHGGETAAPIARAMFETVIRKSGLEPTELDLVAKRAIPGVASGASTPASEGPPPAGALGRRLGESSGAVPSPIVAGPVLADVTGR